MENSEFWLQKKADVLKPGVEHGKLTATVSGYMVKMCASPHRDGKGGGRGVELRHDLSLTLALDGDE